MTFHIYCFILIDIQQTSATEIIRLSVTFVSCVQFIAVKQAYEVLADPQLRALYDEGGEQGIKGTYALSG